jgi:lipoprotein-releasing system permease protein
LEISTAGETDGDNEGVIKRLGEKLGSNYKVIGSNEQHAIMLRTVNIEKLFVFITFTFILGVSSINIFFALSMLAIDKKKDINTFFSMGATERQVRSIFLAEGAVISLTGAMFGLALGYLLCWLQQEVGLVGMGLQTSVVNFYPVKMEWQDFAATSLVIVIITIVASLRPATMAVKYGNSLS